MIQWGIPENDVSDGDVYLTLLRSVLMLSSDGRTGPAIPVPDAQELRRYTFRYSIYPHKGDWREAASYKHALEFNYHLDAIQLRDDRKYPMRKSFLKIEPENVILSALKKAEEGDEVIIRCYETNGEETDAEITLFRTPKSVRAVNMLEEEVDDVEVKKELKIEGERIELTVKPFEIVTLKVKF